MAASCKLAQRLPRPARLPRLASRVCSSAASTGTMQPNPRAALLEAVARGRQPPAAFQVRAPPGGKRPLPPELQVLSIEDLQLCSEQVAGGGGAVAAAAEQQAWVPIRLARRPQQVQQQGPQQEQERLPVVLLLHATGCDMSSLAGQQAALAARGYLAVAVDCRHHGERSAAGEGAACRDAYQDALVRAWRGSGERPFLLDNIWDLQRLLDWLASRPDVDPSRIGMTGVSLGGMHTWLTAAADERVAAAAPMIGVQWFGWAVRKRRYLGRVESIKRVFQAAAQDLSASARQAAEAAAEAAVQQAAQQAASDEQITPEVTAAVWDRLLPGLLEQYDAPHSLPLLAPRPLLIANGELDPRCPIEGVEQALEPARAAYAAAGAADRLELFVDKGVGHEATPAMWARVHAFLDRHLLPPAGAAGGDGGGRGRAV